MGAGISGQARSGEETPARVLLPARVRSNRILDPEAQTVREVQVQLKWGDGSKQPARALVDTGSQSALIRRGLIREKFRYKSAEPKAFYMADDATKLSGGDYQADVMCVMAGKKKGGGGGWEVIQFEVTPYVAEISYDLVLGHPELWNLAVGFAPRMEKGKLFTHAIAHFSPTGFSRVAQPPCCLGSLHCVDPAPFGVGVPR